MILMAVLSAIFYFLSQHSLLSMPLILLFSLAIGWALSRLTGSAAWYGLGLLGFIGSMVNVFAASSLNALFVSAFGTYGTAMITSAEETSSQLNDQNIWRYDAVITTADGRDVKTGFDTMSISLFPPRNEINVPPTGERFVVKYIPGFERNIAVMRDESAFGRRLLVQEARGPVEKARNQLKASPKNPVFRAEYRAALQTFLKDYREAAPQSLVEEYQKELAAISAG